MPFNVTTGEYSDADPVHPVDASATPGVQAQSATAGLLTSADQGAVMDNQGMFAAQARAGEGDARAAMAQAMDARHAAMAHYAQDILPQGSSYGDAMALPPVPSNALPPAQSSLYPYGGLEPVPAQAGYEDAAYGT